MKTLRRFVLYIGLLGGVFIGIGLLADQLFPPLLGPYHILSKEMRLETGELIHVFQTSDDKWRLKTKACDVHPLFLELLVAREDRFFWNHFGVNPLALLRAAKQWITHGKIISGGSTLTMQVVRLLEQRPRTLPNKFFELLRATQLEWRYSKNDILEMYLTLAPFGGNLEGVRAASWAYFGKSADHLNPSEVALLVLLPQSPQRWRGTHFAASVKEDRNRILEFALHQGLIDEDDYKVALEEPLPQQRLPLPRRAHHLAQRLCFNPQAPLISHCTLDISLQDRLQSLAQHILPTLPEQANVAILVTHHPTSTVVAYVGSGDFFDNTRKGQIDYIRAFRSPGSTLKPFIYGLGFDLGLIQPDTFVLNDRWRFGAYAPQNFDHSFSGMVTVREALQHSLNIPVVSLLNQMGAQRLLGLFREAGIIPRYADQTEISGLPLTLGGLGMTLEQLVKLYGGLAQKGMVTPLSFIKEQESPEQVQILSESASRYLCDILSRALGRSLSHKGGPIALKTGTSSSHRDALALGYNQGYVVGIWVGHPEGRPMGQATGESLAVPILQAVFKTLPSADIQTESFTNHTPEGVVGAINPAMFSYGLQQIQESNLQQPRILFPIHDTTIERAFSSEETKPILLKVSHGKRPYTWLINGEPLFTNVHKSQVPWEPTTPGFYEIVVVDHEGQSERVSLEIKEDSN